LAARLLARTRKARCSWSAPACRLRLMPWPFWRGRGAIFS
jgi:hypothetical protein